jgi:hypothetical protein
VSERSDGWSLRLQNLLALRRNKNWVFHHAFAHWQIADVAKVGYAGTDSLSGACVKQTEEK